MRYGSPPAQDKLTENINGSHSWAKQNRFSRLFGVYPFQGLMYSREFIVPVMMTLVIIESFVIPYKTLEIYGIPLTPLSVYILIILSVKLVKTFDFIAKMNRR